MANQFYEERIPIPGFSLTYDNRSTTMYNVHRNIQVDGKNKSLLFLHIKSLNVSNMRIAFTLPDNAKTPQLCFIVIHRDATTDKIVTQFKHIYNTSIFTSGNSSSSLDRFVELINRCINFFVEDAKKDVDIDCRLLYGNFTIENNTLQYNYLNEEHGDTPKKDCNTWFQ